jgi:hypothetical protein
MRRGRWKNWNKRTTPKKNNNDSASKAVHADSHSLIDPLSSDGLAKIPK